MPQIFLLGEAMPSLRATFCLFLLSCSLTPPFVAAQQVPQRDPQAVGILSQCLAVAGGAQHIGAIQDFQASGTITHYWANQEVKGSATVRGRGLDQFRLDSNLPNGAYSWAVSRGSGSIKDIKGNTNPIPYHNAINLGSLTFPYLAALAALQDPSMSISYLGLVTTSGGQAHQIRLRQVFGPKSDPSGILSKLTTRDFFIDPTTFQLLSTLDMVHPQRDSTQDHPHEIQFSDYRSVNGVLVPFSITERIGAQRTWTLQLEQVVFNTGLTDADFQL